MWEVVRGGAADGGAVTLHEGAVTVVGAGRGFLVAGEESDAVTLIHVGEEPDRGPIAAVVGEKEEFWEEFTTGAGAPAQVPC